MFKLKMKGVNMEIYYVQTLASIYKTRQDLATHRKLLSSCLGDRLYYYFKGTFAIENKINPVIL